jgi:hypothetical protein
MVRHPTLWLAVALAVALVAGCQQDEIRSYTVAKPEEDRMLGAILPHGDSTWFIKLTGPAGNVAEDKDAFDRFVDSLRFTDNADAPLGWTLPLGWTESQEKRKDRYATILVGKEHPLELTVTRLGREGQAANVLANVNRWRNQLALVPVTQEELANEVQERKLGADTLTLVDLTGRGGRKAAMAGPVVGDRMPPAVVNRRAELTYRTPERWKKVENSAMSQATFQVAEGGKTANVTVSSLGGGAGGLEANVNRWRGQVGLPPLSEADVRKLVTAIPVAGKECSYVDLAGATSRILAVLVPRDDATWFIKMTGPPELVGKEKKNFEAFAQSVRFDGGTGGKDG